MGDDGKPKYPERIAKIRQVFVDDVEMSFGKLSFVGKDIKELSNEEMQELAVAKDLRGVPLPNSSLSRREMLTLVYVAYAEKVLKKKIKHTEEGFNFTRLPSIILDAKTRIDKTQKITSEEIIEREQSESSTDDPRERFTMEELKEVAAQKNIEYPEGITHKDLYNMLFAA